MAIKSKGYHVWVFFDEPVSASKARIVAKKILLDMGKPETEIFPKQDSLNGNISYGNFINAPLFGKLVPKGRAAFADPNKLTVPSPDQWQLLENVKRISESKLDAIIESGGLNEHPFSTESSEQTGPNCPETDNTTSSFGLPSCSRRMLAEGVGAYQRVSCFRLAVHLKRNGLPFDMALVVLKAWAKKNHPENGKGIITDNEIENQTRCAFEKSYRSLGCEDPVVAAYCDKNCHLYSHKKPK